MNAKVIDIKTRKEPKPRARRIYLTSGEKERVVVLYLCGMTKKEALAVVLEDKNI